MKKYILLIISLLLILCIKVHAQNNKGCFEDNMWQFCNYKEGYLYSSTNKNMSLTLDKLEIGYDKIRNVYSVYVKVDKSIINTDVRFAFNDDELYYYKGIDRISNGVVVISCKNKLSLYTKNYGVTSKNAIKDFKKEGISLYFPEIGTQFYAVPIINKLTEREKKEQQILEEQERAERIKEQERKQQEQIKKEENVKKIFSSVNEVAIESKVTNYFNNKYVEKTKTYKGKLDTLKLGYTGEVNVMIGGDSLGVDVIKIEDEDEKVILDDWIQVAKYYCTLDGINYYEYQGDIFCLKKLNIKTHSFEYGFGGLKNKGRKFKYYRNVPDLVKKACEKNFSQRGEYFFYYLMIDNEVSVKNLELERKQRDAIRGGKTTGRKILNTIGLIGAVALGLIGAAAAG